MIKIRLAFPLLAMCLLLSGCLSTTTSSNVSVETNKDTALAETTMTTDNDSSNETTEISRPVSATSAPSVVYQKVVYWGQTGEKIHINPDCRTIKNGAISGTLDEAKAEGRNGWCGVCSKGWTDERFLQEGNPYAG